MTITPHDNLTIFGEHDQRVVDQLARCVGQEDGSLGVLCADGHFGYSAPIGGVVAYRDHVSPAAVGYDIGCIAAGTRVTTSAGFHRAIEDLRPTDRPARPDQDGRLGDVHPYVGLLARGEQPVLKLTLQDGRTLRLTPDHELRTRGGWQRCDDLGSRDAVLCSVTEGLPFEACSERVEFVRWLGYVNGDGHIRKDRSISGIGTSQWEDVPAIVADLEALGFRPSVSTRRRPNGSYEASVRVADGELVAQLEAAGAPVGRKRGQWRPRLREYLLSLPAWLRAQYLSAFASAEASTPTYLQGPRNLAIKQNEGDAMDHVTALFESLGFRWAVTRESDASGSCHVGQLQGGTEEQLRFFREVGFCYAAGKRRAAAAVTSRVLLAVEERRGRAEVAPRMRMLIEAGDRVRDAARAVGDDFGLSEAACVHLYYRSGRSAPRVRARWQTSADNLGECVWVPVRSVERDEVAQVYDVVTEDPMQAFVAAGMTVHNCGNLAVATNVHADGDFQQTLPGLMDRIFSEVSFGMGRSDGGVTDHPVFDKIAHAEFEPQRALLSTARKQLGTVGAGNHYVDLFADESGRVWIGVHFGSRGFGHKTASGFLAMAQGGSFTDRGVEGEMEAAPDVLRVDSALGHAYIAAMRLAGEYAYAGREVVVDQVLGILARSHSAGRSTTTTTSPGRRRTAARTSGSSARARRRPPRASAGSSAPRWASRR